MADHEQGIVEEAAKLCDELLEKDFEAPQGTLFNNQFLAPTLGFLKTKNKHAVIRLIGELIVPSVTAAALLGRISFKHIWTTTDDIWDYSIPLDESSRASTPTHLVLQSIQSAPSPKDPRSPQTPEYPQPTEKQQLFHLPRPQPTYAVGFSLSVFTSRQRERLAYFVGDAPDLSFLKLQMGHIFPLWSQRLNQRVTLSLSQKGPSQTQWVFLYAELLTCLEL